MNVAAPIFFFAQQRETIDEAYPGDIIGIPNHGTLHVGDSLTEGEVLQFVGIPNFAPGNSAPCRAGRRHARQAAQQGAERSVRGGGRADLPAGRRRWPILGAVGALQLDVLTSRLKQEYGVSIGSKPLPMKRRAGSPAKIRPCSVFATRIARALPRTRNSALVFLARNAWALKRAIEEWPDMKFLSVRER